MDRQRLLIIVSAVVLVAVVATIGILQFKRRTAPDETTVETAGAGSPEILTDAHPMETEAPPPGPEEDVPPQWDLDGVALDGSDDVMGGILRELSSHPRLARLLATEDMVRVFAAGVANIAEGKSPAKTVRQLAPEKPFTPEIAGGEPLMTGRTTARYDDVVGLFLSFPPRESATLYRALSPLLDEAARDLGYTDSNFRRIIGRAVGQLLATPVPRDDVRLRRKVTTYRYADPALESLSPAQKQLLRTGGRNVRRVQQWLRDFAAEADIPVIAPGTGSGGGADL